MNSMPKYIPLIAGYTGDIVAQIIRLSKPEQDSQRKHLVSLLNILLHDIVPKAISRDDVTFYATTAVDKIDNVHLRQKIYSQSTMSSLSQPIVQWSTASVVSWPFAGEIPTTIVDLLSAYSIIRRFFGPRPSTLDIRLSTPAPNTSYLCDDISTVFQVQFKPHDTIEELLADLSFDGISLES